MGLKWTSNSFASLNYLSFTVCAAPDSTRMKNLLCAEEYNFFTFKKTVRPSFPKNDIKNLIVTGNIIIPCDLKVFIRLFWIELTPKRFPTRWYEEALFQLLQCFKVIEHTVTRCSHVSSDVIFPVMIHWLAERYLGISSCKDSTVI